MVDCDPPVDDAEAIRTLAELFDSNSKRFEWMAKQYYDLFAYHAAQRLTAFNFFLVSLSFFSTAYATLISKTEPSSTNYFPVAGVLAGAAYLLVISFGRLDKRNEQIIGINEKPLIRIQRAIRLGLAREGEDGDEVWETFVQAERSYPFRTFGELLPLIYWLAASASAAGAMYGFSGPGDQWNYWFCAGWFAMFLAARLLIYKPLSKRRAGESASKEAAMVSRPIPSKTTPAVTDPSVPQAPGDGALATGEAAIKPETGSTSTPATASDATDIPNPAAKTAAVGEAGDQALRSLAAPKPTKPRKPRGSKPPLE